jgi:hypothetical protein
MLSAQVPGCFPPLHGVLSQKNGVEFVFQVVPDPNRVVNESLD